MIPEELHLRNFLSHRETDLDLRGIHLASLVGENGAGKSALLDAITWAVWGRSRAPYGRDEDLIYHGEDGLEVEFIFRMPYQGGEERRCRILRRREQQGRRASTSILDFQVESSNGWHILTADTIRDTQTRINEQLGLDYSTFINSAYLRQGHADEFTVQSPAQRKRVLSAILGLDRWSLYQAQAKAHLSQYQGQLREADRRLQEMEEELGRRADYEAALVAAEAAAAEAEATLHSVQERVDQLNRIQEQAAALQRQHTTLEQRLAQEAGRLADLEQQYAEQEAQHAHYQDLVTQAEDIESAYAAYTAAVAEERAWVDKLGQAAQLQEQKAQHEAEIATARETLVQELQKLEQAGLAAARALDDARAAREKRISDLQGQIGVLTERFADNRLAQELAEAQVELAHFENLSVELEAIRSQAQQDEVERSRLLERNAQLRELMNETKARLDDLAQAEAVCPLCGQPLSPEHRRELLETIESRGRLMGDEFRNNKARLDALQRAQATAQREMMEMERQVRMRAPLDQRIARLQQQLEQSESAQQRAEQLSAQIADLQAELASDGYAPEERATLARVTQQQADLRRRLEQRDFAPEAHAALERTLQQLASLGYDAKAHESIKETLTKLAPAEARYHELGRARLQAENAALALTRLRTEIKAQQARLENLRGDLEAARAALEGLHPLLAERAGLSQQLADARQQEATARQQVGAARQTIAALQTLERRVEVLREERQGYARQIAVYTELQEAFGVNGIPAMIIEYTLPELESEANHILEQLSGGRMHVRFDTQRETKTGNLRETLDIIISDEKGTRPYENFSGGEQFRINFAIRVALSRILAMRSGVRLRSLFVDEGFGSLDAEGRQRLVEAVKAVQDDFDMIIVITHIDELREAFPTQILVTKLGSGSQVEVM